MWRTKMQIRLGQHWWPKLSVRTFTTSHGVEPGSFGMLARAVPLMHHSMICTPELWAVPRNSAGTRQTSPNRQRFWERDATCNNMQQLSLWQLQQELVNVASCESCDMCKYVEIFSEILRGRQVLMVSGNLMQWFFIWVEMIGGLSHTKARHIGHPNWHNLAHVDEKRIEAGFDPVGRK